MITQLATPLLAMLALAPQEATTDTTFAVDPGGRLEVTGQLAGFVEVRTWDRSEMRVQAEHGSRDELEIRTSGGDVNVRIRSRWGAPAIANMEFTIPRTMAVELEGVELEIRVHDAGGALALSSVEGSIEATGGRGNVAINAVEGDVTLSGARGNVAVNAVDGMVSLRDIEGSVAVQGVDGDILMDGMTSDNVEVNTVDGDVTYRGTIADGGRYFFSTHDGDLSVTVPEDAGVRVSVATFSGELEADFPIRIEGDVGRKRFSFTMGDGSALLEMSAFDGTIYLVRP